MSASARCLALCTLQARSAVVGVSQSHPAGDERGQEGSQPRLKHKRPGEAGNRKGELGPFAIDLKRSTVTSESRLVMYLKKIIGEDIIFIVDLIAPGLDDAPDDQLVRR